MCLYTPPPTPKSGVMRRILLRTGKASDCRGSLTAKVPVGVSEITHAGGVEIQTAVSYKERSGSATPRRPYRHSFIQAQ